MAGSVNKVTLVGNLGKDPEVRTSQNGMKIVSFSLATSDTWNDRQSGERRERTEWHRVVIFNERLADVAERFLRKGRKVYLEGTLQTRKWTGQDGQERYTTEVVIERFRGELVLIDSRAGGDDDDGSSQGGGYGYDRGGNSGGYSAPRQNNPAPRQNTPAQGGWDAPGGNNDLDDEIPF
ncbi:MULTISPECIES: single-stranded DNA-binding protein [Acetobacter]|uniref:Single-stranded DNA-binding protein n=1 Tax=Acetobacter thailandicus TaxID=1502842 RepID=A0ABT3QED6_9PROT|nr:MULTISPECIES: single-stranded DNA-binding protein [Acetobacter]MBS0960700.1 single-stranded DNA-binding protein [Acetobacter thailandicus]MBS0980319.1 single-stranded DNA-binding protein [Acetobacter thailandicus]MBS0986694.1 single-stranded DNA-binding protein [Acetobacter thailandicus]MBS1004011.1 single-stranded DNA-binding protein [Acetobacter thailandicus]MCX2563656.1 single-stranded DNA-binding protein [Acetobacter thailandicus]